MLLRVDPNRLTAERVHGVALSKFKLTELDLQRIVFETLDRLIGEDELLPIMISRQGREEPDLMAIDRNGRLFMFEVKIWESRSENILRILRYGQLFGALDYDGLNEIWKRTRPTSSSLSEAHKSAFGLTAALPDKSFNRKQIFVVLTNGLDVETRKAITYWQSAKLSVRPWLYRVYDEGGSMLLEIIPFRVRDDPLEDQAEASGDRFYILNTNFRNEAMDDADMLSKKKAAAYYEPWKFKIRRLKRGDTIFLYRSGTGIVAFGKASGKSMSKTITTTQKPRGKSIAWL